MPAAAVSFSTPHLTTGSSPQSPPSELKRKWELVAEPGSHPSKKLATPKVIDTSVMSSASLSSLSTSDNNNTTTTISNSNNNNASDASLSAFHRSMFQSYVKNALDDLEKQNTDSINALASRIRLNKSSPEAFTDEQLYYVISSLTNEISRLDSSSSNELVSAALSIKWISMGPTFIQSYVRFLTVLVSGVPRWWSNVIELMVNGFIGNHDTSYHHLVIRHALKLMPTAVSSFQTILCKGFPHKNESKTPTLQYLRNLLKVIEYCPELRGSIWSLIFERTIQLDVELQDILLDSDDENDDEEDNEDSDDEDEEMITPPPTQQEPPNLRVKSHDGDDDDAVLDISKIVQVNTQAAADVSSAEDSVERPISNQEQRDSNSNDDDDDEEGQIHGAASLLDDDDDYEYGVEGGIDVLTVRDKLDYMITLLFEYIDQKITPQSVEEENGEAQVLFTTLLAHFKSFILSTHRTRSVQFLLFRAAHVHPALLDAFLVSLIEIALSPSENMDKRLKAMQYISSFIARAKGLSRTQILFVVSILSSWLQRYVEEREAEIEPNSTSMGKFKMFYAVSQALMYIFCFRHDMLRVDGAKFRSTNKPDSVDSIISNQSTSNSEWEYDLDKLFQRVVISKFNPLRYCRDTVVSKFAQIALRENLVYCFTIMEQNRLGPKQQHQADGATGSSLSRSSSSASLSSAGNGLTTSLAKYMFHSSRNQDFVMLDAYFPFDPLHLPHARTMIEDIYVEWVDEEEDSESDDENSDSDEE